MRIVRLANFLELKYDLKSEGASLPEIMEEIKRNLILSYNLYVNSATAKDPVLQMIADLGEPFSKSLINNMEKTIANIDKLAGSPALLFKMVNGMLGAIQEIKDDPERRVRNFIHDSIRVTKESERNYRERVKSKFETILYRLSSILEKQAKILQVFLPKDKPLAGGMITPERKQLSKDKLLFFSRTPAAKFYGLDSLEVLERVIFYDDLREKLTTLINAIDRGHIPIDGYEIKSATREIMESFKNRDTTNAKEFDEETE